MPQVLKPSVDGPPIQQFGRMNREIVQSPDQSGAHTVRQPDPNVPSQPMRFKTIVLDLSIARTLQKIPNSGTCIWYVDSVNVSGAIDALTDLVKVRFSDQTNDDIPARPGWSMENIQFDCVYISNAPIAGTTATLLIWDNRGGDSAATNAI